MFGQGSGKIGLTAHDPGSVGLLEPWARRDSNSGPLACEASHGGYRGASRLAQARRRAKSGDWGFLARTGFSVGMFGLSSGLKAER